jgi:hypothetical protein
MAERRRFYEALHRNLSDDQLDRIVRRLITSALDGNIRAFRALAYTSDGKPTQSHEIDATITPNRVAVME